MLRLLTLAFALYVITQCQAGCPTGFDEFNFACYLISQTAATSYNDAFYKCFNKGGYLLNVDAIGESNYIIQRLQQQNNFIIGYWTGGVFNGQHWVWQKANEGTIVQTYMDPLGYTNWGPNQPANIVGQQSKMAIMKNFVAGPYKWYSYNQWSTPSFGMSYICEAEYKTP